MAEIFRRWAVTVLVNASAPVAAGSTRNAQAALQHRYDDSRHGAEVLASLRAAAGAPVRAAGRSTA